MIAKRNQFSRLATHYSHRFAFVLLCLFNFSNCFVIKGNNSQEQPMLRFNSDGKLKIVQFTDMHYGEAPDTVWGPEDDLNTTRVIRDVLEYETPDFVIFTGDLVTGDAMFPNVTEYIKMMLQPVVQKQYKWASVYGNHDTAPNVTRLEILQAEQSYGDLCYTKQAVADLPGVGITNYYIPVYANATASVKEKPVMLWWFFDSQGGFTHHGRESWFVDSKVVQWFRNESSSLQSKWGRLPSLAFVHIPTVEYVDVQDNIFANPLCSGLVDDVVTPQEKDTGLMDALLEAGVKTVFVGHEHGNSWCCFYKEIELCYNRHTGYGGYGNQWTRGARVIKLDINSLGNQTNYVRLENGEITDVFPRE